MENKNFPLVMTRDRGEPVNAEPVNAIVQTLDDATQEKIDKLIFEIADLTHSVDRLADHIKLALQMFDIDQRTNSDEII